MATVTLPFPAPTSKVPEPSLMVTQEASLIPWQFLIRDEPYDVPDVVVPPELGCVDGCVVGCVDGCY